MLTLPNFLGRSAIGSAIAARLPFLKSGESELTFVDEDDETAAPATKTRRKSKAETLPKEEPAPRRSPEITDPSAPPKRANPAAKKNQRDMFAAFELPSLELLADPPEDTAPKLDKLALERNARLLENVLDDFKRQGRDYRGAHGARGHYVRARGLRPASKRAALWVWPKISPAI